MATKKNPTSKKKAGSKKASAKSGSFTSPPFQTDDPIIIKPGGSITIRHYDSFVPQGPTGHNLRHRHATANKLTWVVIGHGNGSQDNPIPLQPGDWVQIHYDKSIDP
jgi:hypothetical protein